MLLNFYFFLEGCILLRLLLQSFWAPSIATVLFECFLITSITITYPLHVSDSTGHLQVEHIYIYIYTGYFLPNSPTRFSPLYHGGVQQSNPLPALASQHTICWLYLNVQIANKLGNLKKKKVTIFLQRIRCRRNS
jgi:hypothetical protein